MEKKINELKKELAALSGIVTVLTQDIEQLKTENETLFGTISKLDQEKNASEN